MSAYYYTAEASLEKCSRILSIFIAIIFSHIRCQNNLGELSWGWVNNLKLQENHAQESCPSSERERKFCSCLFTSFIKRDIKLFDVVFVQWRQRNSPRKNVMHLRWKLLLFGVLVDVTLVGSESPLSLHSQGLSTCANYMHKDIRILALTGVYLCFCTLLPRGLFQLTPLWTRRFNIHFHNCHLTVESLSTYQIQFETILSPTR